MDLSGKLSPDNVYLSQIAYCCKKWKKNMVPLGLVVVLEMSSTVTVWSENLSCSDILVNTISTP